MITVQNYSSEAKEFYLDIVNSYDDLSMEIIKTGSKSNPAIIAAGESVNVELSVFAQNAENEEYVIPVTAYVLTNGEYVEDSKNNIKLTCELPILNLSWSLVSSNESTLRQTWLVTNNGETLTDLFVTADEFLKDYVMFSPIVSNYELKTGESIAFEVRPDLAKMKNEVIESLSGNLIALCAGKTSNQNVVFETNGQEITVTTLGQLALNQDENPVTNFELLSESASLQYYNGESFVDIDDTTAQQDILDENDFINLSYYTDIGLGDGQENTFSIQMKSSAVSESDIDSTSVETLEDGTLVVHICQVLSGEEYQNIIDDSLTASIKSSNLLSLQRMSTVQSAQLMSGDDPIEAGERFLLETTFTINDVLNIADYGSDAIGVLNDIYDFGCLVETGVDAVDVSHNPTLTKEQKISYLGASLMKTILTGGKAAVALTNPVVGVFFSLLTKPLEMLLDEYQNQILREAGLAELYMKIDGHQCTNRGRITLSFYVPDYNRSGNSRPRMHTTSRMHGEGYVDKTDTNYDITLNGEDAGTVSNTGLTDVTIADVPTDNLKPGETNVIDYDYDTNPGSHSVTTDTEITILYPTDTEIAYIGDPDDLQDVRTKPDFCVYDENIFASDDLIVNEGGKLFFNAYNRGSRGGWFNIFCYENGNEVYREENYYLEAFSGKTFEIDWTPSAENTTVRVELVNTSIDLEERTTDNNSATRTVTARARQVPEINDLNAGTIYEHTAFSLMVDVEQGVDVTAASFTLDGTIQPTSVRRSDQGSNRRYWLTFDEGLEVGEHSLKADVSYKTSQESESVVSKNLTFSILEEVWIVPYASLSYGTYLSGTNYDFYVYDTKNLTKTEISVAGEEKHVIEPESTGTSRNHYSLDLSAYDPGEKSIEVTIYYRDRNGNEITVIDSATITLVSEEDSYYTFSVGTGIDNPEVNVYRYSSRVSYDFEDTENGVRRCLKTLDMYNNPEIYTVILSYSGGVIVTDMSKSGETITTDACKKLTIEKPDDGSISNATIKRISGIGNSSYNVSLDLDANKTLMFTPGTYSLSLSGEIDGVTFSRSVDVDLSSEDQSIDISSFVLIYYFDIASPIEEEDSSYMVNLYYRNTGNDSWYSGNMTSEYDEETSVLKCYSSSSWTISAIQDSEEALLLITTQTELYAVKIRDNSLDSVFLMDASNTLILPT